MKKKQNTFPEYLTKVTPLSKLLAATLFIALPFLAFAMGVKYQQLVGDPSNQNRCPMYDHRMYMNRPASNYQQSPSIEEKTQNSKEIVWKELKIEPATLLARSFKGFTLRYPSSWILEIIEPLAADHVFVTLKKNSAVIAFKQVVEGRGSCYYQDKKMETEEMGGNFINFFELSKKNMTWRVGNLSHDPTAYEVCESTDSGNYEGFTSIGSISMKDTAKDPQNLDDFKLILSKLTIN